MNKCHQCIHKRNVPWNAHIECVNPDPNMTGNPHGVRNGWFYYPILFDPVWATKKCVNYRAIKKDIPND